MQLTTQMTAEIGAIRTRGHYIIKKVYSCIDDSRKITFETKEFFDASIRELTTYKIRLENILCETDKKEQAHLLMIIY